MNRVILIACLLSGCSAPHPTRVPPPPSGAEMVLPGATAIADGSTIPDAELEAVIASAKEGSPGAAMRLSLHYAPSSPERKFWQRSAAELGVPAAQYNEWVRLKAGPDCAAMREALTWLEKAYVGGVVSDKRKLLDYRNQVAGCEQ